jgi:hypothetical protein
MSWSMPQVAARVANNEFNNCTGMLVAEALMGIGGGDHLRSLCQASLVFPGCGPKARPNAGA